MTLRVMLGIWDHNVERSTGLGSAILKRSRVTALHKLLFSFPKGSSCSTSMGVRAQKPFLVWFFEVKFHTGPGPLWAQVIRGFQHCFQVSPTLRVQGTRALCQESCCADAAYLGTWTHEARDGSKRRGGTKWWKLGAGACHSYSACICVGARKLPTYTPPGDSYVVLFQSCFLFRGYKILPKKELHRSLQVRIMLVE